MTSERHAYRLTDIIELIGGGTPKTNIPEYWNGEIPWLSVKDFNNDDRYVYSTEKSITRAGLDNSSTKMLAPDDIIISARGTVGELAMIPSPMAFNQSCYGIRGRKDIISQPYLYYFLKDSIRLLKSQTHGSVFDTITRDTFANIEINLPPIDAQKAIAAVLSALDDKIELNNRINKNLEAQAQAIFKSWFVDFEPFRDGEFVDSELGPIPKEWRVGLLSELIKVRYGKDHKKLETGEIPTYGSGGIMRYVDKALYEKESVLIPRKGTLNNIIYINEPFWTVDTMFYSEMCSPNVAKYVYFILKLKDLASMNAGTAVPSMTTDILNNIPVIAPPEGLLLRYDQIVSPMFQALKANNTQSQRLAIIRDTLLPKLMSGEIRVPLEV